MTAQSVMASRYNRYCNFQLTVVFISYPDSDVKNVSTDLGRRALCERMTFGIARGVRANVHSLESLNFKAIREAKKGKRTHDKCTGCVRHSVCAAAYWRGGANGGPLPFLPRHLPIGNDFGWVYF